MLPILAPVITDSSQLDPNAQYVYADCVSWRFSEYVELIRGRLLRKMSAPTSVHQQISSNLHGEIYGFLKRKPCRMFAAPFDVRLLRSTGNQRPAPASGDAQIRTVGQPDVCVVSGPMCLRKCSGRP